ncbi:MAG: aspartate-semialdehyde dehydrogenase [Bacteroidia bacterium]
MKVAVVGATGLVGRVMLQVLEERKFPVSELIPVASERSIGQLVQFQGREFPVVSMDEAISRKPDIALFSAGGSTSKEHAPRFAAVGTVVIDNSSAWRMEPGIPLVVPEINANSIGVSKIIANPNCSTIQMVVALAPLHRVYGIRRIVVSTYQSVTGTGKVALQQLLDERQGIEPTRAYAHQIDMNVIPHCDVFLDNDYTREEMKMVNETRKILGDDTIQVSATTVRVPVKGGHSESINVEFHSEFDLEDVKQLIASMPGVVILDDPSQALYPTPLHIEGKDEVFVGRIRRDISQPRTLNLWVVADNLRKGAATNAVQIAEHIAVSQSLTTA